MTSIELKLTTMESNVEKVVSSKINEPLILESVFGHMISFLESVGFKPADIGAYIFKLTEMGRKLASVPGGKGAEVDHTNLCRIEDVVQDATKFGNFVSYLQDCDIDDPDDRDFLKAVYLNYVETFGDFEDEETDDNDDKEGEED